MGSIDGVVVVLGVMVVTVVVFRDVVRVGYGVGEDVEVDGVKMGELEVVIFVKLVIVDVSEVAEEPLVEKGGENKVEEDVEPAVGELVET